MDDIHGKGFDFRGVPGEVYELLEAHNIGMRMTVRNLDPDDPKSPQVIDRIQIFLPHPDSAKDPAVCHCIAIDPDFVTITTPEWRFACKQDRGHATPEGDPDPLFGDHPHLDFNVRPRIPVDLERTRGVCVDGSTKSEKAFRTGEFWMPDTLLPDQDEGLPERLRGNKKPAQVKMRARKGGQGKSKS